MNLKCVKTEQEYPKINYITKPKVIAPCETLLLMAKSLSDTRHQTPDTRHLTPDH